MKGAADKAGDASGSAEADASGVTLALAAGEDEGSAEADASGVALALATGADEGSANDAASVPSGVADSLGSTTVFRTFAAVLFFTSA